jgi:hypothetical protein
METFAAAINEFPDLVDPVDSYVWRETFMQHARRADTALADFNRELDACFGPADALCDLCADLKDSCINLCTTVTANSSNLASLIALMGQTHARVLTLEAAIAKNEANVATTKTALAAFTAAQATTAATVAGFSITMNDAVVDHVGRHFGPLRSNVSSLGQEVVALRPSWQICMGTPLHLLHCLLARQWPMVPSSRISLQLLMRSCLCRKPRLRSLQTRHRPQPLGCRRPRASYFPSWICPTSASMLPNASAFTPIPSINGFPQEDAMTTTWPHLTGTDGLRAILNAPLPPFDRRRPIHTVPLVPTSRTPAPTRL